MAGVRVHRQGLCGQPVRACGTYPAVPHRQGPQTPAQQRIEQ